MKGRDNMIRKKLWLPLLIVLGLSLTACGNMRQGTSGEGETSLVVSKVTGNQKAADNSVATGEDTGLRIGAVEAFEAYVGKYPGAKVEEIGLDVDSGLYVYEVEGYDGTTKYELKISGEDGRLIEEKTQEEKSHKSDGEITKAHVEKVDALVSEALADAGQGARLDEWTLEFERKIPVLEIEIEVAGPKDIEYRYNVETGKLIKKK